MKVRSGFVSNSSSSSFVISDKYFPTIKDLATYMLKKKEEEYIRYESSYYSKDETEKWNNGLKEKTKKEIALLDKIDSELPVSFQSTNYDTYIRKVGDMYLVATCNNIDWDLSRYSSYGLSENAKEALIKLSKEYENEEFDNYGERDYERIIDIIEENYLDEFYHFGKDFFDLNTEIIGVETYDYCPNKDTIEHNGQYKLWDTLNHGKICLVCNPVWKRKEKILQINKNN